MEGAEKRIMLHIIAISVLLTVVVYFLGGPGEVAGKIKSAVKPGIENFQGKNSTDDNADANAMVLDDIVLNLTKEGAPKDRSIIKGPVGNASGGRGGGISAGAGTGCRSEGYLSGTSDYFVKARLERIENVPVEGGNPIVSYTYATVDEYEQANGTGQDIDPQELLIVSIPDSESAEAGTQTFDGSYFTYLNLKKENWGYSVVC